MLERFERQICIDEIGIEGQKKLLSSKVLVIGAGGLGSSVLLYLAAAGIGTIGIIDFDKVSISNFNRQIIYSIDDINSFKVDAAKYRLLSFYPELNINTYPLKLDSLEDGIDIFSRYDIIIDASDNFETRYILNSICLKLKLPFVFAGVSGLEGMLMTIVPYETPCFKCIFPQKPREKTYPGIHGIMGFIPGIFGSLQASEGVRHILNYGSINSKMIIFDSRTLSFREIEICKRSKCECLK